MFNELLGKDAIELGVEAGNWEDAIRQVGLVMERNGIATPEYKEAMIENVHTYGNYIVIAPGLALPHAYSPENVLKPGLVLVTLKEPVAFGNEDFDPVKVLIGVAGSDSTTHLNAMQSLATILYEKEDEFVEDVWECKTADEVMDIISSAKE